jgi:hypothetical protein
MNLAEQVKAAREERAAAEAKLIALQERCTHPVETLESKNYVSTSWHNGDEYWTTKVCGICDKRWNEPQ